MSISEPLFTISIVAYSGLFLAILSLIHDYVKNNLEIFDEDKSKNQ